LLFALPGCQAKLFNVSTLSSLKPMSEGFKIVICISFIMGVVGEFHLFPEEDIFPHWMYLVMFFYTILLWIDERFIPLIKDIDDLFNKS